MPERATGAPRGSWRTSAPAVHSVPDAARLQSRESCHFQDFQRGAYRTGRRLARRFPPKRDPYGAAWCAWPGPMSLAQWGAHMSNVTVRPAVRPSVRPAVRGLPRVYDRTQVSVPRATFTGHDVGRHVSCVDWQGILQRLVDVIGADHAAAWEFRDAMALADIVDTCDGGSVTVLRDRDALGVRG